jgi:hypothetical protein
MPSWYPWRTFHPHAAAWRLTQAIARSNPAFRASLTPQMWSGLRGENHVLPPANVFFQAHGPSFVPPTIFGPPPQ